MLTASLDAGRARAHTKQEQGITETEVLCRETVTGMENALKNEHCPVILTEQRDRIEEEVSVILYFIYKLYLFFCHNNL